MTAKTLEERIADLESKVAQVEARLPLPDPKANKRGWRAIVGIHANNPRFEEAVRLGQEWRNADSPPDDVKN